MSTRRVAAIGLGKRGGPIALHLHEKGPLAAIFSPRTAEEYAAKNRLPASVPLAASSEDTPASADTVLVPAPIHQVESVLLGPDGAAAPDPASLASRTSTPRVLPAGSSFSHRNRG